jgi:hypothetical protein
MAKRNNKHARRAAGQARRKRRHNLSNAKLSQRSQSAYDRSLHVLAAMRRDPKLSLTHATELEGVKRETVKRYFPSALKQAHGKFRVTKSDRNSATLYIPDAQGNSVPVNTRSSKDRQALSRYLRDLGRYLRGSRNALAPWQGKQIAGVPLVTAGRTIVAIEPALSEFSLYRAFNGGAA